MTFYQQPQIWGEAAYWRELAPQLTIEEKTSGHPAKKINPGLMEELSKTLSQDGYLSLPRQFDDVALAPLLRAMTTLRDSRIPPVYIYIYDQPWAMFAELGGLISHFLGNKFAVLPHFWAWDISTEEGARGWPMHQDCQARTRFPDGGGGDLLMSLSLWIPISDATLENGCMAVLPRSNEAHYDLPLDVVNDIDPRHIISLPARAGAVLGWTQDLYHWSNPVTGKATGRRLSLSFEFQSRAFDALTEPLLDISNPPAFKDRLSLITRQFDKYHHMDVNDPRLSQSVTSPG